MDGLIDMADIGNLAKLDQVKVKAQLKIERVIGYLELKMKY